MYEMIISEDEDDPGPNQNFDKKLRAPLPALNLKINQNFYWII